MFPGTVFLVLALFLYLIDSLALLARRPRFGRYSIFPGVLLSLSASMSSAYFFLSDNFAFKAVYEHSSKSLPLPLKLTASWTGAGGSLLLWLTMMAIGALVFRLKSMRSMNTQQRVASVVMDLFTMAVLAFTLMADPFRELGVHVPDGLGQTPSLQTMLSMIHPPLVFAAYTTLLFSYSLIVGSRVTKAEPQPSNERILWGSWMLLTLAISFGGAWAYQTLGWGGYWAWDPIETSALIPWLSLTALLFTKLIDAERDHDLFAATFSASTLIFTVYIARGATTPSLHGYGAFIGGIFILALAVAPVIISLAVVWKRPFEFKTETTRIGLAITDLAFWSVVLIALANLAILFYQSFAPPLFGINPQLGPQLHNYASFPILVMFLTIVTVRCIKHQPVAKDLFFALTFFLILGLAFSFLGFPTGNVLVNFGLPFVFGLLTASAYRILKTAAKGFEFLRSHSLFRYVTFLGLAVLLIGVFVSSSMQTVSTESVHAGESVDVFELELAVVEIVTSPGDRSIFLPPYGKVPESIDTTITYALSNDPSRSMILSLKYYPALDRFVPTPSIHRSVKEDIYLVASATSAVRTATLSAFENGTRTTPTDIGITARKIPAVSLVWSGVAILVIGGLPFVLLEPLPTDDSSASLSPREINQKKARGAPAPRMRRDTSLS